MELTLVGTGIMARGIGLRAIAGGHAVAVRGTSRESSEALAAELLPTRADGREHRRVRGVRSRRRDDGRDRED